ncbi:hypothetical protein Pyn_40538 [Prunus yedoensis var. nudiflora]|uniref:Uncharacterized protein n=1 Tax=Prunus yedoensis var. nudiflora TaxID=2094558 RepID=A0A314ZNM3_PRUYE|nr:hypothetical protein Pyn_40538 [Prunus yedoensis var. nudiflora]
MEWKKVKENGRGFLDKIECSSAYKRRHFLPSTTTHLGCCKPLATMRIDRRQASPLESFNFMLCSSIFLLSLSQNPHPEIASIISHLWNPSILSLVLPLLPIFFYQIAQKLDEAFV